MQKTRDDVYIYIYYGDETKLLMTNSLMRLRKILFDFLPMLTTYRVFRNFFVIIIIL